MNYSKQTAFTLVELIVVVTILAILATIWFVSYSSYLTGVRDTNRLAQLVSISDGLELYRTRNDLPLPDDNVEVQTNGTTIAYQWYVWSNTLETIDFTKGGKDPKDDQYFSYYLTKDRKYFQLMAFLEEEENITAHHRLITTTNAIDYSDRITTVYGKKLWILTDTSNTPIQDTITGTFDITSATTWYIAHMTDTVTLSWSSLLSINPVASCKRIKQMKWGSQDGVYKINPTWADWSQLEVHCDMTTDWGGWTLVASSATWWTWTFGWNISTWIPWILTSPYSMGIGSKDILFTTIMAVTHDGWWSYDVAATIDVDNAQRIADTSTVIWTNESYKTLYDDWILEAEKSWNHSYMFKHWGFITSTWSYFLRDAGVVTTNGLQAGGFVMGGYNATYGTWHWNQWMIFVR